MEQGRHIQKDVMIGGVTGGEEGETTSVLARSNFETPLRKRSGVGVSNREGVRARFRDWGT